MRFDSILVEISATPLYLLLLLALMLAVLHVALVVWWKLDDIAWKRVDYVWLSAAVIGVLVSSAQADRLLSERYARYVEAALTASAYRFLRQTLANPVLCLPHTKSADSPPDFDQMVQEQQALCKQANVQDYDWPPLDQRAQSWMKSLALDFGRVVFVGVAGRLSLSYTLPLALSEANAL